jgi:hypothetical protein
MSIMEMAVFGKQKQHSQRNIENSKLDSSTKKPPLKQE